MYIGLQRVKGRKEMKTICIAPFSMSYSQSSHAWITQFYLQITPCLPFLRKCSPDGATPKWGSRHPIAAYYSFIDPEGMKGSVGVVGWPIADRLPTYKWAPVSYRSSAEQGSCAGQRPTLYRCATQPTRRVRNVILHRGMEVNCSSDCQRPLNL